MAFHWEAAHGGHVPHGAVELGRSGYNNEMMYVARANAGGDIVPGKVVPSHKCAYVGCNNVETKVEHYEVLCHRGHGKMHWAHASNGQVPYGAVEAGKVSSTGETLYVGRGHPPAEPNGTHGGKVHPSHHCCYIPYNGTEHAVHEYEVLCHQ